MRSFLTYCLSVLKALLWPIVFTIGQFAIVVGFTFFFQNQQFSLFLSNHPDLGKTELATSFQNYIETAQYRDQLNTFLSDQALWIVLIGFVVFLPLFLFLYRKYRTDYRDKLSVRQGVRIGSLALSFALLYNITVYNINQIFSFTDLFTGTAPIWISLVTMGILGPILEELLFRGILYNKLKTFNGKMASILLTSIIFGLFHSGFIQVIYGFAFSFLLIYVYEKYHTLKAPILLHIFANSSVTLFLPLFKMNWWWLNITVTVCSILVLGFLLLRIRQEGKGN